MSDTIVVGVAKEPATRRAAGWAVARAAARGEQVELLGVVGGAVGAVGEGELVAAAMAATQEMLDAEAHRHSESGVAIRTRVEVGDPVAALVDASKDAVLIVLGSDYRGPESGPARGSRGIRIVADAACPVVVVPDLELGDRRGVVVGVDGSPVSAGAIAFAAAEAARAGEPLIAVAVWSPIASPRHAPLVIPEDYRSGMNLVAHETLDEALAEVRLQHPGLVIDDRAVEGYPSAVINQLATDARLAVVGSRGRGPVRRFLLGSISHEVLQRLATVTAVVR
ncbi:MAG: universal stress protein [Microbacterium sp.]|uniref:universal stress protein n=1 Tax=Microbacterium sp. TaxID=51671 RepID=UPI003A883F51